MPQAGTIEQLAQELGQALQTVGPRLAPDQIEGFLAELGIGLPPGLSAEAQFAGAVGSAITDLGAAAPTLANLIAAISAENATQIVTDAAQLIEQIAKVFTDFSNASSALHNAASGGAGLTPAQVATLENLALTLARRLLDYAIIEYLRSKAAGFVATLNLIGLIDDDIVPGSPGDVTSPPYQARTIHLERLFDLFTNPQKYLQDTFQWGSATFDGSIVFAKLSTFFESVDLPSIVINAPGQAPLFDAFLLRITPTPTSPPGLTATTRLDATQDFTQTYALSSVWSLNLAASARFDAGLQATVTPPFNIALSNSATITIQTTAGFVAQHADGTPLAIFGQTGGSGLFTQSVGFSAGLQATFDASSHTAQAEPVIGIKIAGGKLVIDTSGADGFVATVTSGVAVNAGFDFDATWAPETGLHVTGGAQLQVNLPLHLTLGPITVPTVYIVGTLDGSGLTIELSAALGLTLGPIEASVDRIGVQGLLSFPGSGGNLGPANLSLGFKPPNGIGLEVDAGVATGGGYIYLDPAKGQYAGVLDISIEDLVQVKVIGVIDTIMPDGSKGFSFLLIITFDFPPIQLGFGFTLNGVGGLGGVNRTMSIDALHAGFRAHTLDSILFPPDPIANAPQIISNIRTFFPVAQGRYVFGPMFEIGWGEPTLITLAIGLILEVPDPIRIALLGLIDCGLPTEDAPLIELHIDVLGTLDFGTKTLEIDGSLYDSRVLIFSLAGDLLFRLCWGSNPIFIFSLGGFNPHFNTAGLNLPTMARMTVSIGDGDNPRISASSYFAITSNTLQFGANVEAYAAAGGFAIHGYLGYDVLIIFSPFSFEFDFSAGFDVSFEGTTLLGLNVDGLFSGPRPWHLHGDASIHILFFSVSASVDLSWGDTTPVTLPSQPVLPDLVTALGASSNWSCTLPAGTVQAVSLTAPTPGDATLLVHPLGTLTVKENVVPLDLTITRYGNATPSDGNIFAIGDVTINTNEESKTSIQDYFAAGQFLDLSDADKLSRPSFEMYDAGVKIGAPAVLSGADSPCPVTYRQFPIPNDSTSPLNLRYFMPATIHASLIRQGAGFASPTKHTGLAKYAPAPGPVPITAKDPVYVIASVTDLTIRGDIAAPSGAAYYSMRAALNAHLALHPEDAANLQILPLHEAAA